MKKQLYYLALGTLFTLNAMETPQTEIHSYTFAGFYRDILIDHYEGTIECLKATNLCNVGDLRESFSQAYVHKKVFVRSQHIEIIKNLKPLQDTEWISPEEISSLKIALTTQHKLRLCNAQDNTENLFGYNKTFTVKTIKQFISHTTNPSPKLSKIVVWLREKELSDNEIITPETTRGASVFFLIHP